MFSCKHRKISTGLLMSFLRQYCTVFSTTSSTVILSSSELAVDVVVGGEVSVMETTKAFPELDAKEAAVSGAEGMLLLCYCDCVVVTSGCVRGGVADPEVISSWLLEVLNADCIKSFSCSSDSRDPS